jgi:hypothetical protein
MSDARCMLVRLIAALTALLTVSAAEKPVTPPDGALRPAPVAHVHEASGPLGEFLSKVNPSSDAAAWAAEAFADRAGGVLKKLAAASEHAGRTDAAACQALAAPDFSAGLLRPAELRTVLRDASLEIRRGEPAATAPARKGPEGLTDALNHWTSAWPEGSEVHTKFKVVTVEVDAAAGTAKTTAFVQSSAETPAGAGQQSATWTCLWKGSADGETAPVLTGISVSEYEEVQPVTDRPVKAGPLFSDVTGTVLGKTEAWKDTLVHGLDYWFRQVDVAFQVPQGYHGVAIRDVDGDGREDVFLCQPAGIRKMLFRRQADGTLQDSSKEAGVDFLDNSRSALFADMDNDGDPDLALTLNFGVVIFANDGQGHFSYRAKADLASWPMSMAAADYDLDGDLDLYLCGYNPRDAAAGGEILANPVPYHDANNGARNFLIRNDGNWRFADATEPSGMDVRNRRFSLAAMWEDYDNDGDSDLLVINDFGRKNLYRNDLISGGKRQPEAHFAEVAAEAGVEDIGAGMSASWGDMDHDGFMDVYIANMFSSAGRRIAYQSKFKAEDTKENLEGYRRHARGNSLFRNHGDGKFEDVSIESSTFMGRWAWASLFADVNNDSWEDLYVCNGFYTRPDPGDL